MPDYQIFKNGFRKAFVKIGDFKKFNFLNVIFKFLNAYIQIFE